MWDGSGRSWRKKQWIIHAHVSGCEPTDGRVRGGGLWVPRTIQLEVWRPLNKSNWVFQVAQWWRSHLPIQETRVQSLVEKIPRRRKWQPTPLFLPGKSHGQRNLVGYSPWGCKESDTAAAAAKSLQSCPTLCDPMDCSLPGFSVHGILQARILEWVRHYLGTKQQQTNPTIISPLHTSLQIANFRRRKCVFGSNK